MAVKIAPSFLYSFASCIVTAKRMSVVSASRCSQAKCLPCAQRQGAADCHLWQPEHGGMHMVRDFS